MFVMIAVVTDYSWASNDTLQHEVLAKKSVRKKKSASTRQRKRKQKRERNLLHPFVLRLLYTPSYRLLSQHGEDVAADDGEVVQMFPFAGGIEGEVLFNDLLSLSLGGSFAWVEPIIEAKYAKFRENSLTEINMWSSFYCNVKNYFKIGVGLALNRRSVSGSEIEIEQNISHKQVTTFTYHNLSAQLDLRRDFFFSWGGFGVGLNIAMPIIDPFMASGKEEFYEGDKLNRSDDKDVDDQQLERLEPFSLVITPMLYFAL